MLSSPFITTTIAYSQRLNKLHIPYLLLALLVGFFLRMHNIDLYDYGADQVMHIQMADGHDLKEVWKLSLHETHPPFGHFIRYFWMKISHDTAWMQLLSPLFDMALIVMFFLLGNRLTPHAGIVAATLTALSPAFISLSQVARNYSFFSVFLVCCLYGYFRFIEKKELKWLGFYTIFGCLTVGTHFGGIIPVFAITLAGLPLFYREKKSLCLWLLANAMIGLLFLFFCWSPEQALLHIVYDFAKPSYDKTTLLLHIAQLMQGLIEYPYYILANSPATIEGEVTSFLFLSTLISIALIRTSHSVFYRIIIIALCIWALLYICSFYNILYRRNIWVAPFIIIPISLVLTKAYITSTLYYRVKRCILACLAVGIALYIIMWPDSPALHDENIRKTDVLALEHYASTHMQPHDIVVGGKSSIISLYFMLLQQNYYEQIPSLSLYTGHNVDVRDIVIKTTSPEGISFISTPFYYRMFPAKRFISFFHNLEKKDWLGTTGSIWFYSTVSGEEWVALRLLKCPALQPEITHHFKAENPVVFLFSLPKNIINEIISPQGRYYHCLS